MSGGGQPAYKDTINHRIYSHLAFAPISCYRVYFIFLCSTELQRLVFAEAGDYVFASSAKLNWDAVEQKKNTVSFCLQEEEEET